MSLTNYTREPDAYGFKRWRHNSKPVLLVELMPKFPIPKRFVAYNTETMDRIAQSGFKTLEEAAEAGEATCNQPSGEQT